MKSIWLNDWQGFNKQKLESVFGLKPNQLDHIDILLASYTNQHDAGYAFILFEQNAQLFEVNCSHDSEADFDGQWQPEDTSIEALLFRLNRGNLGSIKASDNVFDEPLRLLLKQYQQ